MYENYESLAEAIVKKAVTDYREALRSKHSSRLRELEEFFRSDYFNLLVNLNGDIIIKEMRRKFDGNRKAS